ncbi:hypothetical protein CFBP5877_18640 [Agrobacterium tumefaciens]|uniref:Uncharacterized protein n=1 Tax=Agrobacterium tumefaciens TaxID=358 RepID=A0AAE6BDZ9_AGRTU|nr:hypothetical protein [Agrobacterium tumefaciens]QCL81161.1 hypothetical protein CFBP5877_18640 [Agrobacterium tumefaciens]
MTAKPDCVSDYLLQLARDLNGVVNERGTINLDRVTSANVIVHIGRIADLARKLENAWSQAEWNRRASQDRLSLLTSMNRVTAEVLGLMRPDNEGGGNVVQFRPKPNNSPAPSAPSGGDAA